MRLLDVKMVAGRLGVSQTTVYRLIKTKQITCKRMGASKGFRIPEKEVMLLQRYGFSVPSTDDIE